MFSADQVPSFVEDFNKLSVRLVVIHSSGELIAVRVPAHRFFKVFDQLRKIGISSSHPFDYLRSQLGGRGRNDFRISAAWPGRTLRRG